MVTFLFKTQPIKQDIKISGFNSIYYFEFSKNFSHAPEKHNFWEMVYVDNGEILAITNGVGLSLTQGQVIFHEPNEIHAHISNNKVANNMLVISFSSKSEGMKYFRKKTFTLDKSAKVLLSLFIEEAKNALGNISDNYNNKNDLSFENAPFGSTQLLECYLTEFLIKLSRKDLVSSKKILSNDYSRSIAESSIAELMKRFMNEKIYERLTLTDLCKEFLMGKSQISKIFKEKCGISPMAYYSNIKMKEARRLIREENLSVTEIAESLGYNDIYAFSRAFKNQNGFSPTAYKDSII